MTFRQGVAYVLHHAWLWPLEFWLRPLDVLNRLEKVEQANVEIICAILGGAVWGMFAGISVWLWTGEIQDIWILTDAVTFAFIFAVALACGVASGGAFTGNGAGAFAGAFAGAIAFPISFAGAFAGFFAFAAAAAFSGAVIFAYIYTKLNLNYHYGSKAYTNNIAAIFVKPDIVFIAAVSFIAIVIVFIVIIFSLFISFVVEIVAGNNASICAYTLAIVFFGSSLIDIIIIIAGTARAAVVAVIAWVIALIIAGVHIVFPYIFVIFGGFVGAIAGLGLKSTADKQNGLLATSGSLNLRSVKDLQTKWVVEIWLFFVLLSVITTLFLSQKNIEINAKLKILSLFFLITPFIATCFIFWPALSLLSLWKFRINSIPHHTTEYFISSPFFWQTFAYPLPRLRNYLTTLYRQYGFEITLRAVQAVQVRSLQTWAARCAIKDLARDPDTALIFCGQVAMMTNTATLIPLSLAGRAAAAVTALAKIHEKEDEQPLWFYVGIPPLSFQESRKQELHKRLDYALKYIRLCQPSTCLLVEFHMLLEAFLSYTTTSIQNFQSLSQLLPQFVERENINSAWLNEGWRVLETINITLLQLETYRELDTLSARREFLEGLAQSIQSLPWNTFSEYWGAIGKELSSHWVKLLKEEIPHAREWLRLEVQPIHETLATGQQTLQLQIHNPTMTLARKILLRMDETPGLEWHHIDTKRNVLEGRKDVLMSLELEASKQGSFRITGQLTAEDTVGNPFSLPFAFQLRIAQAGQHYRSPEYQPYVTGEGVPNDRTFVGRQELLRWLHGLWLQPEGKAAVALVGQRRIGKTSLLNKIKRDGLPDTQLLPILVNIQGVAGDYDFLNSSAREMAAYLKRPQPALDRTNPYPDFKGFLLGLKPQLGLQRFLLMLDEADLIPQRQLGDLLPGFLRALMQEPEYPMLLLFCGTHALKRMSLEYSSILFNTAQFRTVSYLTAPESAEVLEKPARDILEFDPAALDNAYHLTRGQPLLLQSLGATLINRFNAVVLGGGERSNYVTLSDLDKAAAELAQQDNAAFEQHWQDSDAATHRVLAALAWATDEINRLRLDLPGIEARMVETRLTLSSKDTFQILERLADEEIFLREGPTYRFAVPLYRRWIEWRWPPDRVREEPLD